MGARRDDDDDVRDVDPSVAEMAKDVRKHARCGRRPIEIIHQHHRTALPAAQLTNRWLADRRLELCGDLIVREWCSKTRLELLDVPCRWQAEVNVTVAVPRSGSQDQLPSRTRS